MDLLDLVDEDLLVKLQQSLTDSYGFNVAFTGLDSRPVGGSQRRTASGTICEQLQTNAEGEGLCYKSDKEAGGVAKAEGRIILFRCHCYFSNFVIPITVANDVIGFLYGGQFFCTPLTDTERTEWDKLKSAIGAIILPTNGVLVRAKFFQEDSIKATEEELTQVAESCCLHPDQTEVFVKSYEMQSDPQLDGNRVKTAPSLLRNIQALSVVAHALSDGCNRELALRTYFDVDHRLTELGLRQQKPVVDEHRELGQMLNAFLGNQKTTPAGASSPKIEPILAQAVKVCAVCIEQEEKSTSRKEATCKYLYLAPIGKRKAWNERTRPEAFACSGQGPVLDRLADCVKHIDRVREYRKVLDQYKTFVGPVTWIAIVLGVVLALVFG